MDKKVRERKRGRVIIRIREWRDGVEVRKIAVGKSEETEG